MKAVARLIVLSSLFASTAFADGPLSEIMQKMGMTLKKIEAQSAQVDANPSSAQLSYELEELALSAKKYLPPKVEKMASPDKEAKTVLYKTYLNTLTKQTIDLEEAFLNNKNDVVPALIVEIKKTRKAAHEEFQDE